MDVIINAAWQGAIGLKAEVTVTDIYRPAYNYTRCDYSNGGMAAVWAHIAIKSAILLGRHSAHVGGEECTDAVQRISKYGRSHLQRLVQRVLHHPDSRYKCWRTNGHVSHP